MNTIITLPLLHGARVLVRADFNVPLKGNKIIDARRIEASYKTLDTILKKGGMPVLVAHLGTGDESLRPIAAFLSKKYKIVFVGNDIFDARTIEILAAVPKGTIVLLENIRRYVGEEKNDKAFAKALAKLGEYYVNDAFSVSHRKHASIVGLPKLLPPYAGYQLLAEIKALSAVLGAKKHPFLFMLGGAKFGTKIPLLSRFSGIADNMVIAGAILNNFYQVSGFETGKSVVEDGYGKQIAKLLKDPKLLLPIDVVVMRGTKSIVVTPDDVQKDDVIVDIGTQSIALISEKIAKAKLIVWNGPTGWYEKGFTKGTMALAKAISASKATAVIGGGDTGAVIEKVIGANKRIFISTGGGATLDFLATGTLPGIAVLDLKTVDF